MERGSASGDMDWIRQNPRRMMVGFHIPDYDQLSEYDQAVKEHGIDRILEHIDPRTLARDVRKANIQAFYYYSKGHYGNAYYPSRVGHVHSALNGRDLFGEFTEAFRSEGVLPLGVYEVSDFRMRTDHPDWCHRIPAKPGDAQVDATDAGEGSKVGGPCINGPYGDFVVEQALEIVRNYPIMAYYFDFLGLFGLEAWSCPYCAAKYRQAAGKEFRGTEGMSHRDYVEYVQWHYAQNDLFAKKLRKAIKDVRPDVAFIHNFHGLRDEVGMQRIGFAAENCDFVTADLFNLRNGMLQMSWKMRLFSTVSRHLPAEVLLNTDVCAAGDFVTIKGLDGFRAEMWTARCVNVATCSALIMSVDGTYTQDTFAMNKKVYDEHEQFEPCLRDMQPVAEVGIVRSHDTLDFRPPEEQWIRGIEVNTHGMAFEGWCQALIASHALWDIIPEMMLTEKHLRKFKLVVLPNVSCLSTAHARAIRNYVRGGGKLIATGDTSLFDRLGEPRKDFALSDIFGAGFLNGRDPGRKELVISDKSLLPREPWITKKIIFKNGQLGVKARRGARVCAEMNTMIPGAMVNIAIPANLPGILTNRAGRGTCWYFAGTPGFHFRCVGENTTRRLMCKLIKKLVGNTSPVTLTAPRSVELFAHHQPGKQHLVANLVHVVAGLTRTAGHAGWQNAASPNVFDDIENMPSLPEVTVSFRAPRGRRITKVYRPPSKRALKTTASNKQTSVTLRNVGVHAMLVAEYA